MTRMRRKRAMQGLCAILAFVAAPVSAAPADGATVFRQRCQICHAGTAAPPSALGPNLKGVVGRKAAATAFRYSPAMTQSKIVWTPAVLDKYLAAPTKYVPGTRMVIALTDPAQRAAVIKYLASVQ